MLSFLFVLCFATLITAKRASCREEDHLCLLQLRTEVKRVETHPSIVVTMQTHHPTNAMITRMNSFAGELQHAGIPFVLFVDSRPDRDLSTSRKDDHFMDHLHGHITIFPIHDYDIFHSASDYLTYDPWNASVSPTNPFHRPFRLTPYYMHDACIVGIIQLCQT